MYTFLPGCEVGINKRPLTKTWPRKYTGSTLYWGKGGPINIKRIIEDGRLFIQHRNKQFELSCIVTTRATHIWLMLNASSVNNERTAGRMDGQMGGGVSGRKDGRTRGRTVGWGKGRGGRTAGPSGLAGNAQEVANTLGCKLLGHVQKS
jgi:hypothetical protein